MKVSIIVCLVVVCAFASFDEDEDFLRRVQLTQKQYGKTIIETIQLELGQEQANAVGKIVSMLNQMLEDLKKDRSGSQNQVIAREEDCKQKIKEIDQVTERAIRARVDYERALPLKEEELADKLTQVQARLEELERNGERLKNFQQHRQQEHEEYMQRRDEMMGMVNGLKEAQGIIRQLKESSFLQVKSTVLAELERHHSKFESDFAQSKGYKRISSILMQLCKDQNIHSDQKAVQTILDIISELVESIYDVMKEEMFADDQKTKYFEQDQYRIQLEQNRLTSINVHDNQIVEFQQSRIDEIRQQIAVQNMILENKALERADRVTLCQEERYSTQQVNDLWNEQAQVVQQLIELFENNFSDHIQAVLAELQ